MSVLVLVGCQWGDEGKGKIADFLSEQAQWVARYQGGNNAGHTIVRGPSKIVLHTIPSGILNPGTRSLIGAGVVVDPLSLSKEIDEVESHGIEVRGRLWISDSAHMILPLHSALDRALEQAAGQFRIGTTGRGIGTAYADKMRRQNLRMGDFKSEKCFRAILGRICDSYAPTFERLGQPAPNADEIFAQLWPLHARFAPMLVDGAMVMDEAIRKGDRILAEGAQGVLLDLDHGTYPFVTSSSPAPGGACTGLGIPPTSIGSVLGIFKAYTTRVGSGPFPTELLDETGERIRQIGREFGATTGRARRCGWFDVPAARRALRISGCKTIAIMKIDVLDAFETIRICTHYRRGGQVLDVLPSDLGTNDAGIEPVYEDFAAWGPSRPTAGVREYSKLPAAARAYLRRLEELVEAKVVIVSTGADRDHTIIRQKASLFGR